MLPAASGSLFPAAPPSRPGLCCEEGGGEALPVAQRPAVCPAASEFVTRRPHVGPLALVPVIPGWAVPFLEVCVSLCFRVLEEEGTRSCLLLS